jgi:hypothetical protein
LPLSEPIADRFDSMSELDDVFNAAESLDPDDRLRLIARMWASLPEEYWAAPSARDRADVRAMLLRDDTDRMATLPRKIAQQVAGVPPAPLGAKIYSAPRRFDLATIFVVTFAYSILFALMSGFSFPPTVSVIVGLFITLVGAGQALLFGGRKPRVASVITGAIACVPLTLTTIMLTRRGFRGDEMFVAIPLSGIFGAGFGYIAGVLVGGVFLFADTIRQWFDRRAEASQEEDLELTANEVD